jgi:hypothetical protein
MQRSLSTCLILLAFVCADAEDCSLTPVGSDFEQSPPAWQTEGSVVVDPLVAQNHALSLSGEVGSASSPVTIPASTNSIGVRFRVLAEPKLALRFGSKLVLRVRFYSAHGNSQFSVVELPRSALWQRATVRFSAVREFRDQITIEVLNSPGPVYIDDVCVYPTKA